AFLLIFLPLNGRFSIDLKRNPSLYLARVPAWMLHIIKFQLAIVYFYAGLAKLNYDWLVEAMPLSIWLKSHTDFPVIGTLFAETWVAYFFSWFGAIYDLSIVFFLWWNKTRPFAYFFVIGFHVMTWLLFPIGVFPWVMIAFSTIFLKEGTHQKILCKLNSLVGITTFDDWRIEHSERPRGSLLIKYLMIAFMAFQLLFPWRYLMYPGNLFWTEEGYRFSWRVMLMEKAGYATFYVIDPETGSSTQIVNSDYLTRRQEIAMSTQPDLILQYAKMLEKIYLGKGMKSPIVKAKVYATLNGQRSQLLIDSSVDLTKKQENFTPKKWITKLR
ncbi:MAG: HTTM domain-containing protein, partial [Bacteroidota bacterium]